MFNNGNDAEGMINKLFNTLKASPTPSLSDIQKMKAEVEKLKADNKAIKKKLILLWNELLKWRPLT